MTTDGSIDTQKPVIEAAVQWAQLLDAETRWHKDLGDKDDLETSDLFAAAEMLSRARYKHLLRDYVAALLSELNRKDQ